MSALIQHSTLPDAVKHHPKGADTAAAGTVYVADGAGGGVFGPVPAPAAGSVDHGTLSGLTDDDHPQYLLVSNLDAAITAYLDRHHVAQDTAANNNTTTMTSFMTGTFVLAHSASYRVISNYIWSMNSPGTDILVELRIDGVTIGPTQRHEPQDTAGAGPFGTDQRYPASLMELMFLSAGSHTFELFFAASTTNDDAAIYRGDIFVERYL